MFNVKDVTVLYIDSNTKIRQTYTLFMREHNLKVLEADTTRTAYDLFRAHPIDLIMMDIMLPNENGLEFIRYLRNKELLTPIIITTSVADQKILLDVINLNITRYLIKPCPDNALLDALHLGIKKVFMNHTVNFTDLEHGYYYDPLNKSINHRDGKTVCLSKKEYRLIELLLSNKEQIISYPIIERTVWEDSYMSMDALRTLVRGIRKKTHPDIITNHNGVGYKMNT
ncbi:MAG TPA: response regulator transcription factor [Sulfuricurvum sp.]|nr:response regulator transcription factor [Sulfuricurvum sp.]